MRINYNVSAMISNNALRNSDNLLAQSLERLSSGMKINSAKDNPAGLAMAKRMNAQIDGLAVANTNAGDGVSIIETADGAMTEISEMLQRLNELAVKAANGTNSDSDRGVIQEEVAQLKEEITRIANVTEFNGQRLLDGEFSLKGFTNDLNVKVKSYTPEVDIKQYHIDNITINKEIINGKETGEYTVEIPCLKDNDSDFPQGATASIKDQLLTIEGVNGFEMVLDLTAFDFENMTMPCQINDLEVNATGIGAMRLQIGANEGQVLGVVIPEVSLRDMGIENLDLSTKESATEGIDRIDNAMQYISSVRGRLGAYQNRLESTISSLDVTSENMTAAYSRIMDVDMAEEMTSYTTYQVLTQAGTSMLAQANERPSQVLQLLQ